MPKSKRSVGAAVSSNSTPVECASGTLITMRDEQVPASDRHLQVVDLGMEGGEVELAAAVGEADLGAELVVPSDSLSKLSRPPKVSRSSAEHSGTFSGSLMPPSRKPSAACAFSWTLSETS